MYQKTTHLYQKKTLLTLPQWNPTNAICTHKNSIFFKKKKKKKELSSPCMLHLWTLVYQKANLVAPFHTKNPRDGLPRGFFLATTFYNSHPLLHPSKTPRRHSHLVP